MDKESLKILLQKVSTGKETVESAVESIGNISFEDMEYAHVDHHRSLRKGFPEVIFGEGKTGDQIIGIMERMLRQESVVMVTRLDREKAEKTLSVFPEASYHEDARLLVVARDEIKDTGRGKILVLSAGTSDIPVAKEAFLTATTMGNDTESIYDVGVAGIHRLFHYKEKIERATVLIVVAGMEGALPSVVAGMVSRPVIAVPTSIGYGSAFGGLTPLFAMLNSCSSNVAVVNIDNGFGAGYMASMINRV